MDSSLLEKLGKILHTGESSKDSRGLERSKVDIAVRRALAELNLTLKDIHETEGESENMTAIASDSIGDEFISLVKSRSAEVIDKEALDDFYEDVLSTGAHNGIFITTTYFTEDAISFVEDKPLILIDGVKLSKYLSEEREIKINRVFITGKTDLEIYNHFESTRRKKIIGLFGENEDIEEIEDRYAPLGLFTVMEVENEREAERSIFVNLNTGDIYRIKRNFRRVSLERNDTIGRIMGLPEDLRNDLLELIEHGEMDYEHLEGKNLEILKKKGLISVGTKRRGKGIMPTISDEILSTITLRRSIPTSSSKGRERPIVRSSITLPKLDNSYSLDFFLETGEPDKKFVIDPKEYEIEDIERTLRIITGSAKVKFMESIYYPYYRCKYGSSSGYRYKNYFPISV